jgi:FkbM family methyltransferase
LSNIYLEVGANSLSRVKTFINNHKNEEWNFHLFEPNLACIQSMENKIASYNMPNIKLHPVAVSTSNKSRKFYLGNRGEFSPGSSFYNKGRVIVDNPIEVECIDINKWILDNFNLNDNIRLYMDIEGAEYEVLSHMIKGGSIYYIKYIEVEFHLRKLQKEKEIYPQFSAMDIELRSFFDNFGAEKVLLKL